MAMWKVAEPGRPLTGRLVAKKPPADQSSANCCYSIQVLDFITKELIIDYLLTSNTTYVSTRPLFAYLSSDLLDTLTSGSSPMRQRHHHHAPIQSATRTLFSTASACPTHIGLSFACPRVFAAFDAALRSAVTSSNGTLGCASTTALESNNSNSDSASASNSSDGDGEDSYFVFYQTRENNSEQVTRRGLKMSHDSLRRHRRSLRIDKEITISVPSNQDATSTPSKSEHLLKVQANNATNSSNLLRTALTAQNGPSESNYARVIAGVPVGADDGNPYEYVKGASTSRSHSNNGSPSLPVRHDSIEDSKKRGKLKKKGIFSYSKQQQQPTAAESKTLGLFKIRTTGPSDLEQPPLPVSKTAVNNNYEPAPIREGSAALTNTGSGAVFWPVKQQQQDDSDLKKTARPSDIPLPLPQMSGKQAGGKKPSILSCFPFYHSPRHATTRRGKNSLEEEHVARHSCPAENSGSSPMVVLKPGLNQRVPAGVKALAGLNNVISPVSKNDDRYTQMEGNSKSNAPGVDYRLASRSCPSSIVAEMMQQ